MILENKIKIKIYRRNIGHYNSLGYKVNLDDTIEIFVNELPKGTSIKINVKCDVCGKEKKLSYQKYLKNIKTYHFYSCSQKCSVIKCEKTFYEKYGCKRPMANESIKKKTQLTINKKYKKDCYLQTDEFKDKSKKTCEEKYNSNHPMKNNKIKEKYKQSIIKIYGVENISFLDSIQKKIKNTKIKNNIILPDFMIDDFKLYKRKVKNRTHKNKKQLFKEWSGYDYYDGEYIKNNFNLICTDKNYPTIDHKTSVYAGFIENINPDIIGGIKNLCITKKTLNSKKGNKCFK